MAEAPGIKKTVVGAVEVLKDERAHMWFSAHVLDMIGDDKLLIGFDGNVWPNEEFPYSRVRKPPKHNQTDIDKFNPRAGEEVELRCNATEHQPAAWAAATVKNIKHTFYFVARKSDPSGDAQAIVEKSMLRPCLHVACLDAQRDNMKQETYKIPTALKDWINTDDAAGCFARLEADAGLMFIKVGRSDLKLIGTDKAKQRAKMLLDVHQQHQLKIQNFQEMREKRLSVLEKRKNRIEGTGYKHSIEIQIDPSFVRRVIGKNGETIRAVSQKYEVNIHIPDPEDESESTRTVKIFGNSMENIEKARGEVEFVEEVYPEPIDQATFNWLRGRGDKTLKLFKELTGILYVRLDRDSEQLIICGTRNSVEEAMAMFEAHMMYYPVFSQMDEEMEELLTKLEEYGDWNARREWGWYYDEEEEGYGGKSSGSKGKSKGGKGKDKGDWNQSYRGDKWNDSWKDDWNNDWDDNWKTGKSQKGERNGGKTKGGKGKGWEQEEYKPPLRQSKGAGKGSGKYGGSASAWQPEEEEEDEALEQPQTRGRGRGKGGTRGPRVAAKQDGEPNVEAPVAAAKPAANRKMGKKGIRT